MYISRIHLKNIRCFANLEICFDLNGDSVPFTLLLGDNATGKTTLLRSLAMGLCDESSAAGLMKESDAGYIRQGKNSGQIVIDLKRKNGRKIYSITTNLTKEWAGELLRQKTTPAKKFPWKEIFVSGYGAARGVSGAGDISGYSVINAVYNLFNYSEGLQNPELTILRIANDSSKARVVNALNTFLRTDKIELKGSGIIVDGSWGSMPLRDLADGYKSSFLWVTDFLGWAFNQDDALSDLGDIEGIIFLDEIEQHLHPKWQQQVITQVRTLLPRVQFISTTHSPVIAASIGQVREPIDRDNLIRLALSTGNVVSAEKLPAMREKRADQVLASEAFEYVITSNREINSILREASILKGKGNNRDISEENRYQMLRNMIAEYLISQEETQIESEIVDELDTRTKKWIADLQRKIFGGENDQNKKG